MYVCMYGCMYVSLCFGTVTILCRCLIIVQIIGFLNITNVMLVSLIKQVIITLPQTVTVVRAYRLMYQGFL